MTDAGKGFVYGLHAFSAENQDEISFGPGEQVVVLEKDDQYGDGWWQGRNAAGDEGLFPVSYTSPHPLPPPEEESASTTSTPAAPEIHLSSPPRTAPLQLPPSGSSASVLTNGESSTHMNETITDIQEAIEQLGVRGGLSSTSISGLNNENGSIRSFQSRGEEDSHYDDSIADGASGMGVEGGGRGEETEHDEVGWSASTRKRLAEKAMSENRKREQRETEKELKRRERDESEQHSWAANGGGGAAGLEFSDESEDDDDHNLSPQQPGVSSPLSRHDEEEDHTLTGNSNLHAIPIPVGLDRTLAAGGIGRSPPSSSAVVPAPPSSSSVVDSSTIGLATSSDRLEDPSERAYTSNENLTAGQKATRALESAVSDPSAVSQEPSPFRSVIPDQVEFPPPSQASPSEPDARQRSPTPPAVLQPPAAFALGSPLATNKAATPPVVTPTEQVVANPFNNRNGNGNGQVVSNGGGGGGGVATGISSPASTINEGGAMRPPSPTKSTLRRPTSSSFGAGMGAAGVPGEPLEWGIDEVVEWAKRRGFGPDIWEKFLEHEITGDVLLELDINLLKEIDIVAFGKRHKLATAIADLRNQTHPLFNPSPITGGHAGGSIRSVATSVHPQSPSFFSPSTPGGGRDSMSMSNGLPSPAYASAHSQAQQQQQQYVPRGGSMVGPAGEMLYMSPEGSGRGEFGEGNSPSSANGGYGSVVGLGLGGNDGSRTRESSYGNPLPSSPVRANGNGGTLSRSSSYIRKPSGGESLVGTHIAEEPEAGTKEPSPFQSSSIPSSTPTSSKGFASKLEAASSKTDVASVGSKSSSVPASPASAGPITGAKRGSVGHKKSKQSVDEGGKGSFVGNFLQGSRSGRKPAPRLSSNPTLVTEKMTSPDLAADKSSSSIRASKSSNNASSSPTFRRASNSNGGPAAVLRKRMSVAEPSPTMPSSSTMEGEKEPARALDRLPTPDFAGYLRKKGERYNSWKLRYCVLSGPHLYYLKSENDAKFKGYINMAGYKVIADENANPGYYGFRIIHDKEAPHFFSLQEQGLVREWMKALMKATISRDYSTPVVSSCNIPTMTLKEAQAMSPAPRPPSPSERAAMQAANRRENPNQLTARDASVLMGLSSNSGTARSTIPSSFATPVSVPPRPSREMRRPSGTAAPLPSASTPKSKTSPALTPKSPVVATTPSGEGKNLAWVNSKLPKDFPPVVNNPESFRSGLALVRLVENISGLPTDIPVDDFVVKNKQEHEDLLYRTFDYFIDAGVDVDGLHVEDVVVGNPEGIDRIIERMKDRAGKPKIE